MRYFFVGVRSVIKSAHMALEKGLTLVAGAQMCRLKSYRETIGRIHNSDIGDIIGGQVLRSGGAMGNWRSEEKIRLYEFFEISFLRFLLNGGRRM